MRPAALARETALLAAPLVCWAGVAAAAWELLGSHLGKLATLGFVWVCVAVRQLRRRNRSAERDGQPGSIAGSGRLIMFLGMTFVTAPVLGFVLFAATSSAWPLTARVAALTVLAVASIGAALWGTWLHSRAQTVSR